MGRVSSGSTTTFRTFTPSSRPPSAVSSGGSTAGTIFRGCWCRLGSGATPGICRNRWASLPGRCSALTPGVRWAVAGIPGLAHPEAVSGSDFPKPEVRGGSPAVLRQTLSGDVPGLLSPRGRSLVDLYLPAELDARAAVQRRVCRRSGGATRTKTAVGLAGAGAGPPQGRPQGRVGGGDDAFGSAVLPGGLGGPGAALRWTFRAAPRSGSWPGPGYGVRAPPQTQAQRATPHHGAALPGRWPREARGRGAICSAPSGYG